MPDTHNLPQEPELPPCPFDWAAYKRHKPAVVRIIARLEAESANEGIADNSDLPVANKDSETDTQVTA